MNLDTGPTVNTFFVNYDREGVGDGSFDDWIPDVKAWQSQGFDEKGKPTSLNGTRTDAHQVLGSNASAFATAQARFFCGGQLVGRAPLWCRVLWWTVVAGPLLRVELVFGERRRSRCLESSGTWCLAELL